MKMLKEMILFLIVSLMNLCLLNKLGHFIISVVSERSILKSCRGFRIVRECRGKRESGLKVK